MTASSEVHRDSATPWWLFGIATCVGLLSLLTPWAILVQLALLGVVIYRLTRRPARAEMIALIVAAALLIGVLMLYAATLLGVLLLDSVTSGTSTPLP